jgi:hypothetical protein
VCTPGDGPQTFYGVQFLGIQRTFTRHTTGTRGPSRGTAGDQPFLLPGSITASPLRIALSMKRKNMSEGFIRPMAGEQFSKISSI